MDTSAIHVCFVLKTWQRMKAFVKVRRGKVKNQRSFQINSYLTGTILRCGKFFTCVMESTRQLNNPLVLQHPAKLLRWWVSFSTSAMCTAFQSQFSVIIFRPSFQCHWRPSADWGRWEGKSWIDFATKTHNSGQRGRLMNSYFHPSVPAPIKGTCDKLGRMLWFQMSRLWIMMAQQFVTGWAFECL